RDCMTTLMLVRASSIVPFTNHIGLILLAYSDGRFGGLCPPRSFCFASRAGGFAARTTRKREFFRGPAAPAPQLASLPAVSGLLYNTPSSPVPPVVEVALCRFVLLPLSQTQPVHRSKRPSCLTRLDGQAAGRSAYTRGLPQCFCWVGVQGRRSRPCTPT